MPVSCPICHSDKSSPRAVCNNCHDRNAEADAIHCAREAFARGNIDVAELERRIEAALTNPPAPSWSGVRLVMR